MTAALHEQHAAHLSRPLSPDDFLRTYTCVLGCTDSGHPTHLNERLFRVKGRNFIFRIPSCADRYFYPKELMGILEKAAGVRIISKRDMERIFIRNYKSHWPDKDGLPREFELSGRLELPGITEGPHHAYYRLRDVIHLLPPRPRCLGCGRKAYHWEGSPRYASWEMVSGRKVQVVVCGERCVKRAWQKCWDEEQRTKAELRKELKWISKGRQLLKQTRRLLSQPGALREASKSLSVESRQGGSSQA